jgi:hypothetical protein
MSGMIPYLWGPMAWRQIHGMAHQFDTLPNIDNRVADLFVLFLISLAWTLPCKTCRTSYSGYLNSYMEPNSLGQRGIDTFIASRNLRRFAFDLHNTVNLKLGKPLAESFDLVTRRSEMWGVEFLPSELFGLLFIISLNYKDNMEANKEKHHRRLFAVLPDLLFALGEPNMAVSLEEVQISKIRVLTQDAILSKLYEAYVDWHSQECKEAQPRLLQSKPQTMQELIARYTLCQNK